MEKISDLKRGSRNQSTYLVLRGEGDLGNDGAVLLELLNVNTGHVDGTEDGKLGGVTDLTVAATVLTKDALGAKDTTGKGGLDVLLVGAGALSLGVGNLLLGGGILALAVLGGTIVDGVEIGDGKVVGLFLMTLLLGSAGTVLDNLRDGALQLVLGTLGHVGVVADKVVGSAVGRVNIDLVTGIGGNERGQRHEVLSQSTGLVGADDGDRTQGLDGGKGTDDGILLGHVGHGPGVDDGNDGLETLGNHGNGTDETNLNGIDGRLAGLEEGSEEGTDGGDDNEDGENLGDVVNLLKDGGLLLLDLGNEGCNLIYESKHKYL